MAILGRKSLVLLLLCILLVFCFLQVIGKDIVMMLFILMTLNVGLCLLILDNWRFWIVFELCCDVLMVCKLWNDGDVVYKYDNSENKFKLNFPFHVCLVFLWCTKIQENKSRISCWIVGDEYPCCQQLTILYLKLCIFVMP